MSSPFLAEIRMLACNFAPNGWAFCDGQLMSISQNTALFSLLGTNFGGDGKSNFALPNLQGAAPTHWGQSSQSGGQYFLGQGGGEPTVTLLEQSVPAHTHALQATARPANLNIPGPQTALARSTPVSVYKMPAGAGMPVPLAAAVTPVGSGQPHNNMMPFQTLTFCIALQGIYPQRP